MGKEDYKKYTWTRLGADFNGFLLRNSSWAKGFHYQSIDFGISKAMIGVISINGDMEYIGDTETWKKSYICMTKKIEKDMYYVDKLLNQILRVGKNLNEWSQKEIMNQNLSKLNVYQLCELLDKFVEGEGKLCAIGLLIPLIEFRSFAFVEDNLKKFLKSKVSEDKFPHYFEVFTFPIHNSYAQDEEEDLLKLMEEFYNEKWIKDAKEKSIEELKQIYPKFYEKLEEHSKKHGWVYYSFIGPAYQPKDFLKFIQTFLESNKTPTEKLKEIKSKKQEITLLKEKYMLELNPDEFYKMILNVAGKIVWAKPRRKDNETKTFYHVEKLFKEIAKRLNISLNQARNCPEKILKKSLQAGKIEEKDITYINKIIKHYVIVPTETEEFTLLTGKAAEEFTKNKIIRKEQETNKDISEIKGNTAYPGKYTGNVKIINKSSDMVKMKRGDILVSLATNPTIVLAMKKAGAIVTDEGGLTCHASIVSRELKTPCIVGAKIATQILKDGDKIEVNANTGIIKILK